MRVRCATRWLAGVLACVAFAGCSHAPRTTSAVSPDSIPDAYPASVAALTWPGATRAYQVTADGDLFNGAWFVRIEPRAGNQVAAAPRRIAYEDRWCPVVRWTRSSGAVRWDFEAVAFPEREPAFWSSRGALARMAAARDRAADSAKVAAALAMIPAQYRMNLQVDVRRPVELRLVDRRNLFIALRVAATNLGSSVTEAGLRLRCEAPGRDRPYWDADSLVSTPFDHCWASTRSSDPLLGYAEGTVQERELIRGWRLEPGARASMEAVLPAYPTSGADLAELSRGSHERRVEEARTYWTGETARGAEFVVPDPEVRRAILAARVVLLSARERRDVDWVPLGGPFQYRDVWLRDGARAAEALAVSGYTVESRELTRGLLRFRTRTGTFVSQTGQLDGTGQMLWALEQTMLRPTPARDVREIAGIAQRAWQGLEQQRATTADNGYGWTPGVLPFTNPRDAELVHAQLVGNDAWSLVGYRATERLSRAAG